MSNKSNLLISILVLLLGGVFCWLCESPTLSGKILFLGGLSFLLPAILSLIGLFLTRRGQQVNALQRVIQLVCGVAGVVLGLCVLCMPYFFRSLLGFMFGALLIAGGAWQIFLLARKGRRANYAAWMVVAPVLCLVAGVLMIAMPWFRDELNERWLVLTTGCGFVLFGITGLIISCWRDKKTYVSESTVSETDEGSGSFTRQGINAESSPESIGHQPNDSIH